MGHSRPKSTIQITSANPPRAEVQRTSLLVRFVPLGDIQGMLPTRTSSLALTFVGGASTASQTVIILALLVTHPD
jgi:hypothetical protein